MIANSTAGWHILIVGGVGQVSVASFIGELIILISEPVFEPVAVKDFGLVGVLMHIKKLLLIIITKRPSRNLHSPPPKLFPPARLTAFKSPSALDPLAP